MASALRPVRDRSLWRWVLWAGVALAWAGLAQARGDASLAHGIRLHELPTEARHTLHLIQRGGPYPHERDGVTFGNYEKRLPVAQRDYYREYTVRTPGVPHRGARRVVVGCEREQLKSQTAQPQSSPLWQAHCREGGVVYYTADHYRTFRRVVE